MLQIIKKYANGVFGPEEILILVTAFDDAWQRVQKSGARFNGDGQTVAAREKLAKSIIDLAHLGERDPRRLCDQGLFGFAQSNLKNAPGK